MLRYEISVGDKKYRPFGRFTERPALGSKEMDEARFQTKRGQRIANGEQMPPVTEDLDYAEYGDRRVKKVAQ